MRNVFIGVFILLTGCASVPELQKQLSESTQITSSYDAMAYTQIKPNENIKINLNAQSQTFNFENQKGYYSAFKMPESSYPKNLTIKTYISSSYLPAANIMVPEIILLNQNRSFIGKVSDYRLDRKMDFLVGSYFESTLYIPSGVAYIVLHPSNNYPYSLSVNSSNGHEWPLPLAPSGKINMTLSEPLPNDYDPSTVLLKDSVKVYSDSKVDLFYVSQINAKEITNSMQRTRQNNAGRGLKMSPSIIDREVLIKPSTLTIVGRTEYAAPIQALTNKVYQVKGQISFTPKKNKVYVVKGTLGDTYSAVWVEEEESHQVMDKKIEINGSAELGLMSK